MVAIKILKKIIIVFYNGRGNLDRMIRLYIKEECRKYIEKIYRRFYEICGGMTPVLSDAQRQTPLSSMWRKTTAVLKGWGRCWNGAMSGSVMMDATYSIISGGAPVRTRRVEYSANSGDTYSDYIHAVGALTDKLSRDISRDLDKLAK